MDEFPRPDPMHHPWRTGLITATCLSIAMVLGSMLSEHGYAEWGFVLAFLALWVVTALVWSNDRYIEESSRFLADVVDHNFARTAERLEKLESIVGSLHPEATFDGLEAELPAALHRPRQKRGRS